MIGLRVCSRCGRNELAATVVTLPDGTTVCVRCLTHGDDPGPGQPGQPEETRAA